MSATRDGCSGTAAKPAGSWRAIWRLPQPGESLTFGARSGARRCARRVGGRVRSARAARRLPGAQARGAAMARARDGCTRQRRWRRAQRRPAAQSRHQRRCSCALPIDRETDGTAPPRAGLPWRAAAAGLGRANRDPGRRRHRHRREHARRRARGPCGQSGATHRGRGAGRAGVGVPTTAPTKPTTWCVRRCPPVSEAVGQVFEDFHQVSDDEVRHLLATPTTGRGRFIENR